MVQLLGRIRSRFVGFALEADHRTEHRRADLSVGERVRGTDGQRSAGTLHLRTHPYLIAAGRCKKIYLEFDAQD